MTFSQDGPRLPAANISGFPSNDYFAHPEDNPSGFIVNGTLPTSASQGVHSLTDVPVFAQGPCQETFGGVYNSIDIFFHIATCLGLSQSKAGSSDSSNGYGGHYSGPANRSKYQGGPWGYHQYSEHSPEYGAKGR